MVQFVTVVPLIRVIRGKDQFTYQTPLALKVGELVWIPWRRQTIVGIVMTTQAPAFPMAKAVTARLGSTLSPAYWKFLQWFSDYYYISLASTLYAALPEFVRHPRAMAPVALPAPQRVGIANVERQAAIQQVVKTVLEKQQPVTVLYQRLNEVAAVILGLVKQTTGSVVLICPEEQQLSYWQRVLAKFKPHIVIAKQASSVREAWERLQRQQPGVLLGTKRLALLPLTQAARVIVLDPEHPAHKQWDQNPRYHVQTVVEQQSQPIYFSYAPRLEQYAQQELIDGLLTSTYLPSLTIVQPVGGSVLTPNLVEQVQTANVVVIWHNRTGLGKSLVCKTCQYWTHEMDLITCPRCHAQSFRLAGFGTTMLKRQLTELFPDRPIIEVTAATVLAAVDLSQRPIYVGTSAVFDRLPWEQVDLAIATSLDAQLTWPDFRSHEYTLQQLMWLRNHVPNLVLQTYASEHPVIQAISQLFPAAWYQHTLTERRKLHYPPRGHYIRVIHTKTKAEQVITDLTAIPTTTDWMIDREN